MATSRKGTPKNSQVQASYTYTTNGKKVRKFFYGRTKQEAERKKSEFIESLSNRGKFPPDITVSEWTEICMNTYRANVNPAYLRNDNVPYMRLIREIGDMRVVDVVETNLQKCLDSVSGLSSSTVSKYCCVIKKIFRKARINHIIDEDPSEDITKPSSMSGTHRNLEPWEIRLIVENWHKHRAGLWIIIMLYTGIRRGELIALRWESIDIERRTIDIRESAVLSGGTVIIEKRTKTEAGMRTIPISPTLLEALLTVPEQHRSGIVCKDIRGNPLTVNTFRSGFESFVKSMNRIANGKPSNIHGMRTDINPLDLDTVSFSFRPHDLRHTFATAIHDSGMDIKAAQYFLGHSDIRMTLNLYTHLSADTNNKSVEMMNNYLERWSYDRNLGNS